MLRKQNACAAVCKGSPVARFFAKLPVFSLILARNPV
jgi:hypothetical protein